MPLSQWPDFTQEEIEAVAAVLRSNRVNYWTGNECRQFERELADWAGTKHAIVLANGTVALDLALNALGIGEGDDVVVSPRSFIASASCVVNARAKPIFADVDRDSGNLSAETIEAVLTHRTKAVIVVHLGGYPAAMAPIMALAKEKGLKVIEDCAQAHGAIDHGRCVGSIADIGTWSFCQDKVITTGGEGGAVTVDDPALWRRMWSYKDHGKSWDAVHAQDGPVGFRWLHQSFGTNWRMTEMQAAIGRIQLKRLPRWTSARNANARAIYEALLPLSGPGGPIRLAPFVTNELTGRKSLTHAYYRFYCYVRPKNLARGWNRDRIIRELEKHGIPVFQGSCPEIYNEKAFRDAGLAPPNSLPVARELGESSIAFLVHPSLTVADVEKTSRIAAKVLGSAQLRC